MSKPDEMSKYWAKLFGQAQVLLTGASDAELKIQLFDTLTEFFNDSNCWTEDILFSVIPDTLDYPLFPQSGQIVRLMGVVDQNNSPQQAVMPVIGTVRFLYPYTNAQQMLATVVKTVIDPFGCYPPYIPEWILPIYGNGILAGLIGYMMLQPGQSYSNQGMASFHLSRFRSVLSHAKTATMRANTVGSQVWAFPQQFKVSGQRSGVSTFNMYPTNVLR